MAKVSITALEQTAMTILTRSGHAEADAKIILEVLMYAQLRGNNQGIVKLIGAGLPRNPDATPIRTVHQTPLSTLLDGGWNNSMVVMKHALTLAIGYARERGFGMVGTHNTNTSTGAIGYYAHQIASEGLIGLIFSGSGEYVAMHGSYEAIFGTNPLAVGIPTSGTPLVFDMATSAIARYGLIEAKTANRPIPSDVAYDADGNLTTDPAAALAGAIRTFGGYKGAGLSIVVEVLTRALVGASRDQAGRKLDWGNLVMVIDPALLTERGAFTAQVEDLIERVKATKKLPGVDEILVPGERGNRIREAALAEGALEIEDGLWSALQQAAAH
jgi:LDH2 family malate/lactate/ureidoglycolate dehydrogenase